MANFFTTYMDGKKGLNFGLTTGIKKLDRAINGLQKKTSIGLAAAPKTGKTTLADFCFVLSPFLEMENLGRLDDIEWVYWSYEIDRINKEFKYAAFFMAHDFGIYNFTYKNRLYQMSQDYLMGRLVHKNEDESIEMVVVSEEHEEMLKEIYQKRIKVLFGEYSQQGKLTKKGKIYLIEEPDNPTGMWHTILYYAKANGTILEEEYDGSENGVRVKKKRMVGYNEKNPKKYTIFITDHVRKCRRERGFTMKENIDKFLEYSTIGRNLFYFTFINIIHSNRSLSNVERLRMMGEWIFPTADDVKDTGNLAEESTTLMTLFNPKDEKYNLDKHMEVDISGDNHPNYRSLHITESRYTDCPVHIQLNMYANINQFTPLIN